VLIYPEIGMDIMTTKLASLRLATVQVTAWGHPETSGLPTMDYYLSAECFEPLNAQSNYTEKLVSLPNLGCCYQPETVKSSTTDLTRLGINPNSPILLSPGVPYKYAPQHDHVFVDIARKLGSCQLIFFTHTKRELSAKFQQRLVLAFANAGLNFDDFCVFIPWQGKPEFYGLMHRADVFLDTIGFSGFNTAMQAMECGLPLVTLEGRFMRGRLASGILRRMNLTELITDSNAAYVDLAVKLVQDAEYRHDIRTRIAASRAILFDDRLPVYALETFLHEAIKKAAN
jgi:predicted O-linked N-acetylglucosamine transferase (SPINDLY family)